MEGTVQIALKDFERLLEEADEAKKLRQQLNKIGQEVRDIVTEIDERESKPLFDEINERHMTDTQIHRKYLEARKYIGYGYEEGMQIADLIGVSDKILDKMQIEIREE